MSSAFINGEAIKEAAGSASPFQNFQTNLIISITAVIMVILMIIGVIYMMTGFRF
jgi:hypothetical protein